MVSCEFLQLYHVITSNAVLAINCVQQYQSLSPYQVYWVSSPSDKESFIRKGRSLPGFSR